MQHISYTVSFHIWIFYIWRVAHLRLTRHRNFRLGKFELGGGHGGKETTIKSYKIDETHIGYILKKIEGRVFSEGSGRRRQRNTHAPCWDTPKPTKRYKN